MISPEFFRRFSFFSFMNDAQLKALAMISEEVTLEINETILEAGQKANLLYILIDGSVSNYCVVSDSNYQGYYKEFFVTEINPGEIFGFSALIEPYEYTATARVSKPGRAIKINARPLRALCEADALLGYNLMREMTRVAVDRLNDTHILLAAAYA
jgi:CRP-like cAMP-binding protein